MISGFFDNLLKVLLIGAGFASIPLLASFAAIEPPWPPAIAELSGAAVFIAALVTWEWGRRRSLRSRRRWLLIGLGATVVGLLGYLVLYSQFVDAIPGSSGRAVRGYECTANAKLVYGAACPNLPADALQNAEWESTELWTRQSVTVIRMLLASVWMVFTCGLVTVVANVVVGRKV